MRGSCWSRRGSYGNVSPHPTLSQKTRPGWGNRFSIPTSPKTGEKWGTPLLWKVFQVKIPTLSQKTRPGWGNRFSIPTSPKTEKWGTPLLWKVFQIKIPTLSQKTQAGWGNRIPAIPFASS